MPWWALASISVVGCGSTNEQGDTSASGGSTLATAGGAGPSSTGAGAMTGVEGDLFFPEGIEIWPPPIEMPGLTLIAYTLRDGDQGLELYVALRNDSEKPACGASISVDLYDLEERSLGSSVIGVIGGAPYQVVELPNTYSACVPPGHVAMAALTDWPADVSLETVRYLAYRCPYFDLTVTSAGEFLLREVTRESTPAGDVYRGTLTNQLEITVANPQVVIFPLAASGRPLDMLSVLGTTTLPPAASWVFESAPTEVKGDDFTIFPSASQSSSE